MNIITSNNIPDSTYFTATDVEPTLTNGDLAIYNGKGTRRGWGAPSVTSTVIINNEGLTVIHVGFSHKHRGGQGWYYFVNNVRKTWGQLADDLRHTVLDNAAKAPSWAKSPGKLKVEKKAPVVAKQTAYKLVKVTEDGRMVSLFQSATEYQIGKRLAQKAQPEHEGGYYAYPTSEGVKQLWQNGTLVPTRCYEGVSKVALIEVEVSGTIIEYGSKLSATYLKPVRVVETINV